MRGASMPEPDIFVTRETPTTGAIRVETVTLIVEIADTTADFDLGDKMAIYAVNGVAEYWVVDLKTKQVRQFWSPSEQTYRDERSVAFGAPIRAATIPDLSVSTDGL